MSANIPANSIDPVPENGAANIPAWVLMIARKVNQIVQRLSDALVLAGSTSGTITVRAPAVAGINTATFPANTGTVAELNLAQTWTAAQTFSDGDLLLAGSTSGTLTLKAAAIAGTNTITFPAATDTGAVLATAQTWSANQSFNSGNFLLKGSSSGTLTVKPAAVAGTNTLTLPAGTTDFSATGGTSQVVKQTSAGGALTVAQLAASDLSNGTSGTGAVALVNGPTFTGAVTAPNYKANTAPTSAVALEATADGTVGNGSNVALPVYSGMIVLTETGSVNGSTTIYIVGGGAVQQVGTPTAGMWIAPTTTPGAGSASVAFAAGSYKIYNNRGGTLTYRALFLATRDTA